MMRSDLSHQPLPDIRFFQSKTGILECDDSNWPLAIVLGEEAPSLAAHRHFLERWMTWLDRSRPFVLLRIYANPEALIEPPGAAAETAAWLTVNGEKVRALVAGIAASAPPSHLDRLAPQELKRFGVPARMFDSSRTAVAWLREEILAPIGLRIDTL